MTAEEVLRLALISGLFGFVVFCACYAFTVWRKRNAAAANSAFRLSCSTAVVGFVALAIFWANQELAPREGLVEGKDLFVVHARRDATLYRMTEADTVSKGDLLAEFSPPAIEAQLSVLDNRIAEARTRIKGLELRALPVEPLLVQQQSRLRGELDRERSFGFELRRSLRELEKDDLSLLTQWTRERSQLEAELDAATRQRDSYVAQVKLAQEAVTRMSDLHKREIVSMQLVDDRNMKMLGLKLDRDRSEASMKSIRARMAAMEERYANHGQAIAEQRQRLNSDIKTVEQSEQSLAEQLAKIDDKIRTDLTRATAAVASEIESSRHQLAALEAERERVVAGTKVRAPSDGQVVYRHPAPGFVPDNAPVLAISAGSGFGARMLVPAGDVAELAATGTVQFALDKSPLNRYFRGEYKRYEELPHDPTKVIAHFDVQLPPEVITALASAPDKALPARLRWRPDMLNERPVQASALAVALGIFGAFASAAWGRTGPRRHARPEPPLPKPGPARGPGDAPLFMPAPWEVDRRRRSAPLRAPAHSRE